MQVLPPHGKAIKTWKDKDEAWTKVTLGLSSICDKRLENKSFLSSKVQPNFGKNVQNSIEKIIQAECRNHDFTIGVFGMTGVGVSSLCNFLVGNDVSRVNDVASTTTKVEVYSINVQNRRVAILCCPGLGESPELDEIYEALYRRLLKEIEMSIWIIRADNVRVLSTELRFIRGPLEPFVREPRNFLLAMNMVDRVDPIGNWDNKNARPGDNQMVNIERRIFYVAERLGIESNLIVPVSVFEEYNLDQIMLKISAAVASPR
jgi:predicted GTPase